MTDVLYQVIYLFENHSHPKMEHEASADTYHFRSESEICK